MFPQIQKKKKHQLVQLTFLVIDSYGEFIGEGTSIIAHSLGPAFAHNYIIAEKKKVNNLYLVAPFYGLINIEEFDDFNKTFFVYPDLSIAKDYFHKAWCFFSDNDPYVPNKMSQDISPPFPLPKS